MQRWLIEQASRCPSGGALLGELVRRLREAGVPVSRAAVGVRVLHPMVRDITWVIDGEGRVAEHRPYGHDIEDSPAYLRSPIRALHRGAAELHRPLVGPEAVLDYPVLQELAEAGFTAWAGFGFSSSTGAPNAATFTTDAPGGFSEAQLALLREIVPALALVLEIRVQRIVAEALLGTYLGQDAGQRVLAGQVRLGDIEAIRAVIWLSDLRGFTRRSDSMSREALLRVLNALFERQVGPVQEQGGEVLKFMGDGLLAIFRVDAYESPRAACEAALRAARDTLSRLDDYNAAGGEGGPLQLGLALHLGDVVFGNMGAPDRMDFTVIGEAVNLASRVERLCKQLQRDVLMTGAVADSLGEDAALEAMGRHSLPGLAEPADVYALGGLKGR
ncbi:MAG: adenylate/guanylate cyclase domain-containing protein [Alphaproteobacteria bacterium]|nr:adenylate/guanylate cyclase domain-containing protein [Alphaproteobacteria bacterium]MCB9794682.1 adenylate/guanylate cyclase domain-containing protein [Alphaproteobacteria bacterium]